MTDSAFDRIMAGMTEALRHAQGEHVPGMVIHKVWYGEDGEPHVERIEPSDFYVTEGRAK